MKTLNVRLDDDTHGLLLRQAASYNRSLNGQINWLITTEGDPDTVQEIHIPREVLATVHAVLDDNERFKLALEVCGVVLSHPAPPDSWVRDAQIAAFAGHSAAWRIADVEDRELRARAERMLDLQP